MLQHEAFLTAKTYVYEFGVVSIHFGLPTRALLAWNSRKFLAILMCSRSSPKNKIVSKGNLSSVVYRH